MKDNRCKFEAMNALMMFFNVPFMPVLLEVIGCTIKIFLGTHDGNVPLNSVLAII